MTTDNTIGRNCDQIEFAEEESSDEKHESVAVTSHDIYFSTQP